ncbi:hypothetical protein, partial [Mycolicibacterium frederiksbergense]
MTEKKTEPEAVEPTADVESTAVELDKATESAEAEAAEAAEAAEGTEATEAAESTEASDAVASDVSAKPSGSGSRVLAYGILPALALLLAVGAGYLKWQDNSVRDGDTARIESVQNAKDTTIALLSYKPDTVEQQLTDARSLLTGDFAQAYTDLTTDVVIPGSKEKQISAVATVPAAA